MPALLLSMMLFQAAAAPPAPTAKPSVMTQPDWVRKPNAEEFARYYPEQAQRKHEGGRATFECKVAVDGSLVDCKVLEESPQGDGFGEAALKVAALFKMRPLTKDGVPVPGGTVRVPIRFVLPEGAVDTMSAELSCYGQAAALADREPKSSDAWTAMAYFSTQIAAQSAMAGSTPTMFEASLASAHRGAGATARPGPYEADLRRCIEFANKRMQAVIPK